VATQRSLSDGIFHHRDGLIPKVTWDANVGAKSLNRESGREDTDGNAEEYDTRDDNEYPEQSTQWFAWNEISVSNRRHGHDGPPHSLTDTHMPAVVEYVILPHFGEPYKMGAADLE